MWLQYARSRVPRSGKGVSWMRLLHRLTSMLEMDRTAVFKPHQTAIHYLHVSEGGKMLTHLSEPEPEPEPAQTTEMHTVTCPKGVAPGDELSVEIDGVEMLLHVPEGVGLGDEFEMMVHDGTDETLSTDKLEPEPEPQPKPKPKPEPEPEPELEPEMDLAAYKRAVLDKLAAMQALAQLQPEREPAAESQAAQEEEENDPSEFWSASFGAPMIRGQHYTELTVLERGDFGCFIGRKYTNNCSLTIAQFIVHQNLISRDVSDRMLGLQWCQRWFITTDGQQRLFTSKAGC